MAVWMIGMQNRTVLDKRRYGQEAQKYNPNLTENYVQRGRKHEDAHSVTSTAHNPWSIDGDSQPLDHFPLQNSSHLTFLG